MIHWNIRSIKWSSSTFGRLPSNERRWYRPPHHMQSSLSNPNAHLEQSLVATLPINSGGQCNQTSLHPHDPHENLQLSQGACSLWWKHQVSKVLLDLSFHAMQCATPQGSYSFMTATDSLDMANVSRCLTMSHVIMSCSGTSPSIYDWHQSPAGPVEGTICWKTV